MKKQFSKSAVMLLSAVLIILCTAGAFLYYNTPTKQFERSINRLFCDELAASTLNMHYTLAYPADFGIENYEPVLPCYDGSRREENLASLKKEILFYRELDCEKLSARDAHTAKLLQTYLENTLQLSQYPYHEEPLSPSSGMQSQLPILLAEYTFRSVRDVEDYLALLSQTGDYFASLLQFEKEKKEAGLLTAASSLRSTAKQCRSILTAEALNAGEHFLQITFKDRLDELCESSAHHDVDFVTSPLTESDKEAYIDQNNRILSKIMLPAYESLAKGLEALADPSILLEGLAARPHGADYYEILLQYETGSPRSISEISSLLTNQLESEHAQLRTLLKELDYTYLSEEAAENCDELFPLKSCEAMLTDLRTRMQNLFPDFPEGDHATPHIHIKEVAECLKDYCAPAFYLTPPIDDCLTNAIYINTASPITMVDLYTTLAHEGFPGHLYQTVYSNQMQLQQDAVPIQQLLWFGGYLEGWALYVEFMAYDYASQIMQESGYPEYASLIQIEKHNRSTQLCLYSLLDILIHHKNADLQQTAEVLANFGITNSASVSAVFEYIAEEPANYPQYYLGYLEILLLKDVCREVWGKDYSEYTFHKFFLDNGPTDFGTLSDLVLPYSSIIRSR